MAIPDDDFIHGAALTKIADSSQFTALNRASEKLGHYIVNHDRHLLIKYTKKNGPEFPFSFHEDHKRLLVDCRAKGTAFAVLVCGHEVVAALTVKELGKLIDLASPATEVIYVTAEPGQMLGFRSASGQLPQIARYAFPDRVLI